MQFTRFTDYGIRSLMYLANRPDQLSTVRQISEYYGISHHHTVKVVHKLSQLGYVEGSRGKGGGIKIACDPSKLRLGDLITQLEPNMDLVECFDPKTNSCRITESCRLKHFLFDANRKFIEDLNQHTLQDTLIPKDGI